MLFLQQKYIENGLSTHHGCSTKTIHTSTRINSSFSPFQPLDLVWFPDPSTPPTSGSGNQTTLELYQNSLVPRPPLVRVGPGDETTTKRATTIKSGVVIVWKAVEDRAAGSNLRMVRPSLMLVVKLLKFHAQSARQKFEPWYRKSGNFRC